MDLSKFAKTTFYAGPPTEASARELMWSDIGYTLRVIEWRGSVVASMDCGSGVWVRVISTESFVSDVNSALADACYLARKRCGLDLL